MHRSRLSVLMIFAAVAACSPHDDSPETDLLSEDHALVARLEMDGDARPVALPASCGTVPVSARPALASQTLAKELTLQAQGADMQGNVKEARTLLRRAFLLDETNKSAAYHLGRTNEALGDSAAALSAYCRYLALAPTTAESAEARQRVTDLSRAETRVSAGSVSETAAPARRRASKIVAPRAARVRPIRTRRLVASANSADMSPAVEVAVAGSDASDASAAQRPMPPAEPAPEPSRTERRGASRTQTTVVGAAAGAIIGAATGRSVKSAVIGAAAGGILGTIVNSGARRM